MNSIRLAALTGLLSSVAFAGNFTPGDIPEPGTLILMGIGFAGMALVARKRMKR